MDSMVNIKLHIWAGTNNVFEIKVYQLIDWTIQGKKLITTIIQLLRLLHDNLWYPE